MPDNQTSTKQWEHQGIKIIVNNGLYLLGLPNVRMLPPEESGSGAWEAWHSAGTELREKLVEFHTELDLREEDFYHVLTGMEFAFAIGLKEGQDQIQKAARFAFRALSGEADIAPLLNAADEEEADRGQ